MLPIELRLWSGGATPYGGLGGGEAPEKFSGFYVNFRPGGIVTKSQTAIQGVRMNSRLILRIS